MDRETESEEQRERCGAGSIEREGFARDSFHAFIFELGIQSHL